MSGDDHNQIVGVINLYALAVDTQRWALFDRVFTPDLQLRTLNGVWSGLEDMRRFWAAFHEPLHASTHTFTNHQVIVDGDRAHAISYVVVRLMKPMEAGEGFYEAGGWYDDTLVRTPDGWRIAARNYGTNWWRGNPRVGGDDFIPDDTPLKAAAAADDIGYVRALNGR
jgi:hypothetical protein